MKYCFSIDKERESAVDAFIRKHSEIHDDIFSIKTSQGILAIHCLEELT